jgi:glycosyltransferase involved in cell wall biosynthesis
MLTLSVLLPVFNAEQTIKSAIVSVLKDLGAKDELVICNDASTDCTLDRIKEVQDDRIILINNSRNQGISDTLNNALEISKGDIISRMDADDLWIIGRRNFIIQFFSLPQNSNTVLFGSYNIFNKTSKTQLKKNEYSPKKLNIVSLILKGDFLHPTMSILKRNMLRYESELCGIEDMYLYFHLLNKGMIFYKSEVLFLDYFREDRKYDIFKRYRLQLRLVKKSFKWSSCFQSVKLFIVFSGAYFLKLTGLFTKDKKFN